MWSSIFRLLKQDFSYEKVPEHLLNASNEIVDFDTDFYYVDKKNHYCLANFLFSVLAEKYQKSQKNYLFIDYSPSTSVKHQLGKTYRIVNKYFTHHTPTI